MDKVRCEGCNQIGTLSQDRYTASNDISCSRCGYVYSENPIVSEVQFSENSQGGAVVQGAMVGLGEANAATGGRHSALESREQTIKNARKQMKKIAVALRIKEHIFEAAVHWFKLALLNNFVQGRRSQNVWAACLYVSCRKERTHHMLIDFSSLLQISVYSLGASFLKMVKALHIVNLPLADPSIFIQHFAEKLEFGNMVTKVAKDANKLAQRMADDWIHEGRRPAGIAGACILLAARMNNFRRSHAEIVEIAHVGEETIQKRLNEFRNTNSAKLTVKQIRDGTIVEPSKPPSFAKNRELESKVKDMLMSSQDRERQVGKLIENYVPSDEEENDQNDQNDLDDQNAKGSNENKPNDSTDQKLNPLKKGRKGADERLNEEHERKNKLMRTILSDSTLTEEELKRYCAKALQRQAARLKNSLYVNPLEKSERELEEERMIELNRPRNLVLNLPKTKDILDKVSSEVNEFDDISDGELDALILTKESHLEEIEMKERLWTGLNQDFLLTQEKKRLKQEADELTGNTSGVTKRKKKRNSNKIAESGDLANDIGMRHALQDVGVDAETGEPISAAASALSMLLKTKFSKKINYSAVDNLFNKS